MTIELVAAEEIEPGDVVTQAADGSVWRAAENVVRRYGPLSFVQRATGMTDTGAAIRYLSTDPALMERTVARGLRKLGYLLVRMPLAEDGEFTGLALSEGQWREYWHCQRFVRTEGWPDFTRYFVAIRDGEVVVRDEFFPLSATVA